jgi:hypothetical protein
MGNRTYLIQASTPAPFEYDENSPNVLAAAKNCIPIYWYSLFEVSSMAANSVLCSDGSAFTYPCFVTPTSEARARCRARKQILERLTPSSHRSVLESWLSFLDLIELPFLHVNTAEFCMMDDDSDRLIRACLEAFDAPPRPQTSFGADPAWAQMLDVAQIDPDDLAGTVMSHKLAGFQWIRPVPWD